MTHYEPITTVTIYVRPRKIIRNGKRIDGWQSGFSRGKGGCTHIDKYEAIKYQQGVAERMGVRVVDVIEESR